MQQHILETVKDIPQEKKGRVIAFSTLVRIAACVLFAIGLTWTIQQQKGLTSKQIAGYEDIEIEEMESYLLEYDEEDILTAYVEMVEDNQEEENSWLMDEKNDDIYIEYILDEELSIEEILQTDPELFEELCIAC